MFEERLRAALPLRADRVLHRVRETRGGKLYDSRFGVRGTGEGHYADATAPSSSPTVKRLGFNAEFPDTAGTFARPNRSRQLALF